MPKSKPSPADFDHLAAAMDHESYEYLAANAPAILAGLKAEIDKGHTPIEIELYIIGEYQRPEIANRLKQAARHLLREQAAG